MYRDGASNQAPTKVDSPGVTENKYLKNDLPIFFPKKKGLFFPVFLMEL